MWAFRSCIAGHPVLLLMYPKPYAGESNADEMKNQMETIVTGIQKSGV